jgi:hypothetical protein
LCALYAAPGRGETCIGSGSTTLCHKFRDGCKLRPSSVASNATFFEISRFRAIYATYGKTFAKVWHRPTSRTGRVRTGSVRSARPPRRPIGAPAAHLLRAFASDERCEQVGLVAFERRARPSDAKIERRAEPSRQTQHDRLSSAFGALKASESQQRNIAFAHDGDRRCGLRGYTTRVR